MPRPKTRKRQIMRNPNSFGSIKKLSGNRRRPYMVCVNPHINDAGSYSYDVLGYYEDRPAAMIALAEYNKDPIDIRNRNLTFADVYEAFYKDKFVLSKKKLSERSEYAARAAFKNCESLHQKRFTELRYSDLQAVIDSCPLKHASLELIVNLLHQMYQFAMREEYVQKDASEFVKINIEDDDEHGIRIADADIKVLWEHAEKEYARIILIYIYTGWRATELLEIAKVNIDLSEMTMIGGKKTKAGKNRLIPIHSRIQGFIREFVERDGDYLFSASDKPLPYDKFKKNFYAALDELNIQTKYTPHDCRHTFSSLLSDAGIPDVIQDRLMGHSGKNLDEKVYIHKTIVQLREAIEKLP